MNKPIEVLVWNEFRQEREEAAVRAVYPRGIHETIADALAEHPDFAVTTATLDEPEHGLTESRLAKTQVVIWWGHRVHHEVSEAVAERLARRVEAGLGLLVLHSAHFSRVFIRLMGTSCTLGRHEVDGRREQVQVVAPDHPIARGLPASFDLPRTEMYGEPFDVPEPDWLIFLSLFECGEMFRSGCAWKRGHGRVFYFRPGHETFPIYHDPQVKRVIAHAVRWLGAPAAP